MLTSSAALFIGERWHGNASSFSQAGDNPLISRHNRQKWPKKEKIIIYLSFICYTSINIIVIDIIIIIIVVIILNMRIF